MDKVLQTEVLLNLINTFFAKSVFFKDVGSIEKLNILRHQIYYEDFDYSIAMRELGKISGNLKKYE